MGGYGESLFDTWGHQQGTPQSLLFIGAGAGEKLTGSATLGQADEFQAGTAQTEAEQQCKRTNIMQEKPKHRLITGTADE